MNELARVTFEETTYELLPWSIADAQRWFFKLVTLAGPTVAGTVGGDVPLAVFLMQLDEHTFAQLWNTCRAYTRKVVIEKGQELLPLLSDLETKKVDPVKTDFLHVMLLIREHTNIEYESFFTRLPAHLKAGRDGSGLKSPPA